MTSTRTPTNWRCLCCGGNHPDTTCTCVFAPEGGCIAHNRAGCGYGHVFEDIYTQCPTCLAEGRAYLRHPSIYRDGRDLPQTA